MCYSLSFTHVAWRGTPNYQATEQRYVCADKSQITSEMCPYSIQLFARGYELVLVLGKESDWIKS